MKKFLLWAGVSLLLGASAAAQAPGPIAKIYFVKVKPGMQAKFEEAYKAHIAWHRAQKDTWVWDAWQFESGARVGQYAVVTPGHAWADFDARGDMDKADSAQAQEHLMPLMESLEVSWSRALPNVSGMPDNMQKVAVAQVTDFRVRPGMDFEFLGVIGKVSKALADMEGRGPALWTQSLTGDGSIYTMIDMHPDWASLEPPAKPLIERLAGKLGALSAAQLVKTFSECVEGTHTNLVRYREDLSYQPNTP